MEYKNFEFRNKSFHTLLFVLAVVLQYRLHLCWGAPVTVSTVGAVEDDINSNTTIINGTLTATAAASSSEELGDEFAWCLSDVISAHCQIEIVLSQIFSTPTSLQITKIWFKLIAQHLKIYLKTKHIKKYENGYQFSYSTSLLGERVPSVVISGTLILMNVATLLDIGHYSFIDSKEVQLRKREDVLPNEWIFVERYYSRDNK